MSFQNGLIVKSPLTHYPMIPRRREPYQWKTQKKLRINVFFSGRTTKRGGGRDKPPEPLSKMEKMDEKWMKSF